MIIKAARLDALKGNLIIPLGWRKNSDMTENPYFNYLRYVRDVLGAQSIVGESRELNLRDHFFHPDPKLELGQKWDLMIVNSIFSSFESLFEEEAQDLFQKMLKAMNLGDRKILCVDSHLMNEREIVRRWRGYGLPEAMIIFKDHPEISEDLRLIEDTAIIETYSPYHLTHHPEYKKIVWNHLQKVMLHLGIKN